MEYITAEEFLKQPEKVQKVFLEWWKPNKQDFVRVVDNEDEIIIGYNKPPFYTTISFKDNRFRTTYKEMMIPLFTEGQLRKFIEDKTGNKFDTINGLDYEFRFQFYRYIDKDNYFFVEEIKIRSEQYIKALWELACKIASEEVSNE